MTERSEEKRRFPRLGLHTPIRYQVRGQPQFDNTISNDISLGGLSFIGNSFIPPQTPVMLEVNILSKILRAVGKISWAQSIPHSYRNRIGVEFLEMPNEEKQYLDEYLNMQLK